MSISLIFLVVAFICFLCAACNVPSRVNLIALGLAFWVLSLLIGVLR
jgi:hypothetical protein